MALPLPLESLPGKTVISDLRKQAHKIMDYLDDIFFMGTLLMNEKRQYCLV